MRGFVVAGLMVFHSAVVFASGQLRPRAPSEQFDLIAG
jgi:hypothetical protein